MCAICIKNTEDRFADSGAGERMGSKANHRLYEIYNSVELSKRMIATLNDITEVQKKCDEAVLKWEMSHVI